MLGLVMVAGSPPLSTAAAFKIIAAAARQQMSSTEPVPAKEQTETKSMNVTFELTPGNGSSSDQSAIANTAPSTSNSSFPSILSKERPQSVSRQKVPPPVPPRTPKKRNGSEDRGGKGLMIGPSVNFIVVAA